LPLSCFSLSRNVVLIDARVSKNDPDAEIKQSSRRAACMR
jgi:hypothetical protein